MKGYRTYLAGAALVLSSAASYFAGEITGPVAIQGALTGLMGIFLRSGIKAAA